MNTTLLILMGLTGSTNGGTSIHIITIFKTGALKCFGVLLK